MLPEQPLTDSRLANLGASAIRDGFEAYQVRFNVITARARGRFEQRDWRGMQADATERLDVYTLAVEQVLTALSELLQDRILDKLVWIPMKAVYSGLIEDRKDWELAETFFNSVTRRLFDTVGVDNKIEFVDSDFGVPPTRSRHPVYRTYLRTGSTAALFETILADYSFAVPYTDAPRDARLVAAEVERHLKEVGALRIVQRVELCWAVFYRNKEAYLVGRLYSGAQLLPLVLALVNTEAGVAVDAVLLDEGEVSVLFSFTRSYFHVQVDRPYDLVQFPKSILPRKRIAELYISIGYHKHGKTELYRELLRHLAASDDKFEIAPGERGMVMSVFTLPSVDLIFKIIKDRFADPKTSTRAVVVGKYRLVFRHDRAGRLVDAQEFEHLEFDRDRFDDSLLDELLNVAAGTVSLQGDQVVIRHAYVERRVIPLNIYVREADEEAARAAVVDYGNAIKDLAASNIFPGDLLLKNFGVTRRSRVVFYDYDELALLTDCQFSAMPASRSDEEDLDSEAWFYVAENQVFPQELRTFLGLMGPYRDLFEQHHADLFEPEFWQGMQARLRAGEVIDIFPYPQSKRLVSAVVG